MIKLYRLYENTTENKRYFYQLDGEGIRYEIVAFVKAVENGKMTDCVPREISKAICSVVSGKNRNEIVL